METSQLWLYTKLCLVIVEIVSYNCTNIIIYLVMPIEIGFKTWINNMMSKVEPIFLCCINIVHHCCPSGLKKTLFCDSLVDREVALQSLGTQSAKVGTTGCQCLWPMTKLHSGTVYFEYWSFYARFLQSLLRLARQ